MLLNRAIESKISEEELRALLFKENDMKVLLEDPRLCWQCRKLVRCVRHQMQC